jgi:hypothetical protein
MQHYKEVITNKKITGCNAKLAYFAGGKNLLTLKCNINKNWAFFKKKLSIFF